jgi:hypothetical protein
VTPREFASAATRTSRRRLRETKSNRGDGKISPRGNFSKNFRWLGREFRLWCRHEIGCSARARVRDARRDAWKYRNGAIERDGGAARVGGEDK